MIRVSISMANRRVTISVNISWINLNKKSPSSKKPNCFKKNPHQTTCYDEKDFTPKLITSLGVMQMVIKIETLEEKMNLYRWVFYTLIYIE